MLPEEANLVAMAESLTKSGDYRVLRRLVPRTEFVPLDGQATKTGIMLDVETTGLDTAKDEIIELAMVKFAYLPDDRIARITDVFSSFNEPQTPIPAEITDLTGITDEMVLGHRINPDAVATFASDVVIVIAHNASFDRKFAEFRSRTTMTQKAKQRVTPTSANGSQRNAEQIGGGQRLCRTPTAGHGSAQ